jgi:hypothetical protein
MMIIFEDDIVNRFVELVKVAFGEETLEGVFPSYAFANYG